MSLEAMVAVLNHSAAVGTQKLVLLGLANHEREDGAWCSLQTLARYANVDVRSVRRALAGLVAAGELEVEERPGRTSRYRVLVGCPSTCDRSTQHRDLSTTPDASVPGTPDVDVRGLAHTPDAGVRGTPDVDVRGPDSDPGRQRPPTPDASVRGPRTPASAEPVLEPVMNLLQQPQTPNDAVDNPDPPGEAPDPADAGPALAVEILAAKAAAAGMPVRWDTLTADEVDEVAALVAVHGDEALITAARNSRAAHATPAVSARAWLPGWRVLPPPGMRLAAVPEARCLEHPTEAARTCRACAADRKAAR